MRFVRRHLVFLFLISLLTGPLLAQSPPGASDTSAQGTIGALLTGVFASKLINPLFKDAQGNAVAMGMIDGNYHQILNQLVGVVFATVLAVVGTYIILRVVDFVVGVRVSAEHEAQGLDITQHGEEGYYWETSMP